MKRLTALILAAAILAAVCAPVPAAAIGNPAFSVSIVGTADSDKQLGGKDTLVLDWQIRAERSGLTLQNTQGLRLAYDNTVLQLARWDAASAIDDGTIQTNSFASVSGAYGAGAYQYNMRVFAAKSGDANIGYLSLALGDADETCVCEQGADVSLLKVRFAFRDGKTLSDLAPSSIRIMTTQELHTLNQATGVLLNTNENDGVSYEYAKHSAGVATGNDTLNAPKITYPGNIGTISSANVTGFAAPAMGATPIAAEALGTADEHYAITSIAWSPPVLSTFAPNTAYTVTVVLTADPSCKFAAITPTIDADAAPAEGIVSADEEGNTLTFAVTFPQTSNKTDVSGAITFEGASPTYDRNPKLLTATSTDGTGGSFAYSYVGTGGTTYTASAAAPANAGTYSVTATYESETAIGTKTASLTIGKAPLAIAGVAATGREYDGTTAVELAGGSLEGVISPDDVTFELGSGTIATADAGIEKPVATSIALGGSEAGNYELAQPTVTVNIAQANISGATVTIDGSYTYTGSAITPQADDVAVSLGGRTLISQTDYTFEASNNTNVGTAKLTVTGQGNYTGSKEQDFAIAQKSVAASDLAYAIPQGNAYTGQPQGIGSVTGAGGIGEITVRYTGKPGTAYETSTGAPANAGTYAVTADIAASADYAATSDLALGDYTIAKAPLIITGADIGAKTYDGTAAATVSGVAFGGEQNSETLAINADYTVVGAAFDAAGARSRTVTGTVALTGSDMAKNYSLADGALSQPAEIAPADYAYDVAGTQQINVGSGLSAITAAPAGGTGIGETVAGTLAWHRGSASGELAQDGDISGLSVGDSVTLYWSFAASDPNYIAAPKTGSTEFEIVDGDPQEISFETAGPIAKIYGAATFANAAANASSGGGAVSYESDNTSVATVGGAGEVTILSAGTATITATAAAVPGMWRETSASYTLIVNPKTLTDEMVSILGTYTYNGSAQSPSYTVKDGETTLAVAADYAAEVPSEVNANSYALTVTGAGNYSGSARKDFVIAPKTLGDEMLSISGTYTYDGTAQSPAYTVTDGAALAKGADYMETAPLSATDAGDYRLAVTGRGNYAGTASQPFIIAKANLAFGDISANLAPVTYDGAAKPVTVSILGKIGFGALTVKYGGSEDAPVDAGNYAVTADVASGINFNGLADIQLGTYTIAKASVSGASQSVNAREGVARSYAIGIETLLPSNVSAAQVAECAPETAADSDGIIDGSPAISGGTLSIPIKGSAAAGQTASIQIAFTSANYDISDATVTVNVTAKSPVTISGVTVASRAYDGSAIAHSGTPVFTDDGGTVELAPVFTWSSGASAPAGAGSYTLTVSADGGDDYDVSPLTISFEITKADQAISLAAPTISRVGQSEALAASAASGLPVAFATSDGALAAITGGVLALIGEGTVTITASQPGDSNYNAAPDAFCVIAILPAVSDDATLSNLAIGDGIALSPAFEPAAASYAASVGSGVGSVTILATASHANAAVSGDGAKQLNIGPNRIEIIVTAEDGTTTKTYTITVTRAQPSDSASGGGSSAPAPSPSAPAAGGSVSISYTRSGGAVTLALPDSKVAELIEKSSGMASIDLTAAANATTVNLPKTALAKLADAELGIEIKLPQGSITLEAAAAASAAGQAGGYSVTIALKAVATSSLNELQRKAAGSAPVFDVSILSGSKAITSFDGGLITIALPYALKAREKASGVVVRHIDELGNIEKLSTMYDTRARMAVFATSHLSLYAIAYEETAQGDATARPGAAWQNPFDDVKAGDWFYGDVEYAVANGLLRGTGATTFSPDTPMTRAMLVTVLCRLAAPESGADAARFTDVPPDEWYSDAVAWAAEIGIVSGVGDNMFAPNAEIKRQDLAVLLHRYAQAQLADGGGQLAGDGGELADGGGQLAGDTGALAGYGDAEAVSEYARGALAWAISAGIMRGGDTNSLNPQGFATRAETAAMLHRFLSE